MARKIYRGWGRVTGLAGGIGLIGLTAILSGVLVMSQASMGNPVFAALDCPGPFPLGNGLEATPYIVTTSAQLDAIDTAGCLDEHFRQDADIALTGTWTPISGFVGTYDGGGNEITNLVLSGSDAGLFNVGNAPATVKNLTVRVSSTAGAIQDVGAIVGEALGSLVITNVHVFGDVSGRLDGVGGLVGWSEDEDLILEVSDSSVTGNVSTENIDSYSSVGGVVGYWLGSVTISNTRLKGDVTGTGAGVGGLVGDAGSLDVSNSTVTGNVSALNVGSESLVGGVVGYANTTVRISETSVIGNVTGTGDYVGGLIGDIYTETPQDGSPPPPRSKLFVSKSSVIGNVSTGDDQDLDSWVNWVGGVVGAADGPVDISETAVIGDVSGTGNGVGGLVGKSFNGPLEVEDAFFRGTVTGGCSCFGGIVGHNDGAPGTTLTRTYVAGSVRRLVGEFGDSELDLNRSYCTRATSEFPDGLNSSWGNYCYSSSDPGWLATDAQLKSRSFLEEDLLENPGWDFVNVWCVSPNVNGGYPVLRAITTPAVGFAACWAPVAVSTPGRPAAPVASILQVTLDPNSGVCMVDGQRRDVSWTTKFVDNHYLPGNKDCEREGFTFEGWADVIKPDVVLDLPKLAQPTDGVTRPFLTRSADLIAVWKKPDETEVDTDDLTGTAPGAFVGGADRRTREGGGVVEGYYIPPNTVFGPWMAMDDLAGTAPGVFVGGADRRTREGGGVVDGYYIPPNTVFGPWMLAR